MAIMIGTQVTPEEIEAKLVGDSTKQGAVREVGC